LFGRHTDSRRDAYVEPIRSVSQFTYGNAIGNGVRAAALQRTTQFPVGGRAQRFVIVAKCLEESGPGRRQINRSALELPARREFARRSQIVITAMDALLGWGE
jgi:hypothetical protein